MERWSSHAVFLLAAIGAAVGLGNVWRFPALLGEYGGGAFLVPYLIVVFVFALPLMILEITMGRHFRGSVVSSFGAVRPEFRILGWLLCAVVFLLVSYYLVLTGWTIAFTVFAIAGQATTFSDLTGSYMPILYTIVAVLLTGLVVAGGIKNGIERVSVVMVPLIAVILVAMVLYCTTLPGFWDGIRFMFTPDFSVLFHADIWFVAFGQAFFSLSVGQGILLTYGAYMEKDQNIPRSALVISMADLFVALLAGMVIFPIVFSFGMSPTAGTELAFTTLPLAFSVMPAGKLIGVAFFIVLFFAAFTSAIAMFEVSVSSVDEALGWDRKKTAILLTGILLIVSLLPALSYSAAHLSLDGVPILDIMDEMVGNLGLHVVVAIFAIVFTWFLPEEIFESECGRVTGFHRLIFFLCKYVIPAALLLMLGMHFIAGF